MAYRIEFTPEARRHFADISARDRGRVRDALVAQLVHEPSTETRQRKRMRPNALAGFRLRVGELRVYYDVNESVGLVVVQAIGRKHRNRVLIGGEEIEL